MSENNIKIQDSWKLVLNEEFNKPYFQNLVEFLREEKASKTIYPPGSLIFNAFNSTPFNQVKVVILGQDPYHGTGQAHGLCFSVQKGIKPPPSLVNIYKELHTDIGMPIPSHGCLQGWANQGVFLLNAILTVEANKAASHQNKGWEIFTDSVIEKLSSQRENLVFMLWGNYAKNKINLIDTNKHFVLTAAHPSPFSAYNGFFGCKHFSKANQYLIETGQAPVEWRIE
jgi:uracil-DNA glycosylase